jgi:DNA-binding CsgD family transcriptional regulator/PAS domain-containing protein
VRNAAKLLAVTEHLYDAAANSEAWTSAIDALTGALNADHSILIVSENASGNAVITSSAGMRVSDFERFLSPEGRRSSELFLGPLPVGKAVRSSDIFPDRDFERSAYYNEYVRPLNGFYSVAVLQQSRALSTSIALCRPRRSGDFASAAVSNVQMVLPHFATAVKLRHRLHFAEHRYARVAGVLDQLQDGVIVVDAAAAIVFANRAGEGVLSACNGLHLSKGRLAATHPATDAALQRLIAQSTRNTIDRRQAGDSLHIMRGGGRDPLHAFVSPFKMRDDDMEPRGVGEHLAIVFLADPEQARMADKDRWRRQFGLTAAEANFALEIVKGDGRRASAERLGISVSTARAHLTHIFEKTGTRRQAALVRLLLSRGG